MRIALLLATLATTLAAAAAAPASDGVRTETVASRTLCGAARLPGSYGWPVQPFDVQHPVRGNFGDPRIINGGFPTSTLPRASYGFHNGVDISAPDGTPVYPVDNGVVRYVGLDYISVGNGHRIFQYWHIHPSVVAHEHVFADRTTLGTIIAGQGHVHLAEIDSGHVTNPLAPGHLFPYRDLRPPTVDSVGVLGGRGPQLQGSHIRGTVEIVAEAHDVPSLPVPGRWAGMPVTPARLSWTLTRTNGGTVAHGTSVDFRRSLPTRRQFWTVYAPGTSQNFPVVDNRRLTGTPGRYIFRVARLDTRRLGPGRYTLRVDATDVCGNVGTLTRTLDVPGG